ncbi:MAG: GNAT family N-acetyltransferase, partial [Candidatus Phosphoribacter baldrii]
DAPECHAERRHRRPLVSPGRVVLARRFGMPPAHCAGRHTSWSVGRCTGPLPNALGVATAYRRRGVARALMEAAAGTAVSMAGTRLGLAVASTPRACA